MNDLANATRCDPETMSGVPVFAGTRVPVRPLFDYLEGGETLQEFLRQFPSVRHEQTITVLDAAFVKVADAIAA